MSKREHSYRVKLLYETTIDFGVIKTDSRGKSIKEAEERLAYDTTLKEELSEHKWKIYVKKEL